MITNKPFIQEIIKLRKEKKDMVLKFSVRNKSSPVDRWSKFIQFDNQQLNQFIDLRIIDGIKLKFKYTTLVINSRY